MPEEPLLSLRDLHVTFHQPGQKMHALNGVSFDLAKGEVLGLLGESGSGKSITLRSILRLLPKTADISGNIMFNGQEVLKLAPKPLRALRGAGISMIFQEPMTALDPTYTIGDQIAEAVLAHENCSQKEARARALEMLDRVRIPNAVRRMQNYPQEMSGGMRQRVMIALALSTKPSLLLADEPTTALDVTVQIQILLLLRQLQKEMGMSMIFVTHDVGAALEVSDRLAVMYGGRVVEMGGKVQVMNSPLHPYSNGLIGAVRSRVSGGTLRGIAGAPPQLSEAPANCVFAPRCPSAQSDCLAVMPELRQFGEAHRAACLHPVGPEGFVQR